MNRGKNVWTELGMNEPISEIKSFNVKIFGDKRELIAIFGDLLSVQIQKKGYESITINTEDLQGIQNVCKARKIEYEVLP